jgi:hypothetical protein
MEIGGISGKVGINSLERVQIAVVYNTNTEWE